MRRFLILVLVLGVVAAACTSSVENTAEPGEALQPDDPVEQRIGSFAGTEPAPEFPEDLDWLNVDGPVTMAALRGKVVLLDFWTYGCINCIHIIPDLKQLEAEYPDELVVIGVHSAKFENEAETDNIRDVVARYDLEHPVVNDRDFAVWNLWGARAWPTLVLIDPAGNVVGGHAGEGIYEVFQTVIGSLVDEFDETGRIDRDPLQLALERDAIPDSVLSFPGKVLADETGGRLFVADTNHHRIVVADLDSGAVSAVIGSGARGFADGSFESARFDQPQGMELSSDGTVLYVADTGNHSIRAADLGDGSVTTLLGTGEQASSYPPFPGADADVPLASPWDLAREGSTLYIAMAGSHQLWSLDLATGVSAWFAGTGRESTLNGPRFEAELAQPSAVVVVGDRLIFADSESSSIRYAEIAERGETGVLAGSDENLFDFGDADGVGTEARLQHPLGLAVAGDSVFVADTYNSKIKLLDPVSGSIETFAGGVQGWSDGPASSSSFSEPGGLSATASTLFVADTNNHAIRTIDLETGHVDTFLIYGVEAFPQAAADGVVEIDVGSVLFGAADAGILIDVLLPAGFKVNDLAPLSASWTTAAGRAGSASVAGPVFPLSIPVELTPGPFTLDLTTYYCRAEAEDLCFIDRVRLFGEMQAGSENDAVFLERLIPIPGA
jgi:thiol-disulfide isomerase/thioredoxin